MATTPVRITRNALKNMADGDDAKERLLHEYQTFQHGLAPVKRRRVSSLASETSEASVSTTHEPTTTAESPTGASVASADERPLPKQKLSTESVAELELASDEKALDGAPEGELYVVNVLTRDEFQPAVDADAEVAEVNEVVETKQAAGEESKSDAEEQLSWAKEYAAIDSLRRIAIHHADRLPELTKEALPVLVCPAASSLRSAMARNALLCIQDIVLALKSECDGFLNQVIPLLLHRTANEKQFIRDLARDVLTSCIDCCPNDALLRELLRISTTEKNAQVVSSAGVHASTCIEKMEKAHVKAFTLSHESLVEELSAFLNCKVVECKVATRKTFQYLRKTVGDAEFTTLVKEKLQGSAQMEVLKASEERKKPAPVKSGLPRLSMRERMMQMKKQQAAKGEDDVVVVAAPPPPSSTTR